MAKKELNEKEQSSIEKNTVNIDPATVVAVIGLLILLPLLLTGFLSN